LEILVSYNVVRINRETYSLLQLLGDVGGLYDALLFLGVFLLGNFTNVKFFSLLLP